MSQLNDAFGLPVTSATPQAVKALDIFGQEWISYGPDLAVLFPAAAAEPACALATAYAALLHMSLEAAEGYKAAQPFLERLTNAHVTPREAAIIAAARAWGQQDYKAALEAFETAVQLAPADIVAAKWGQYLAFNLGDAPAMLRLGKLVMQAHRNTPEAWGMLAFAQEQSHQLHAAEESAREALARNPAEAWAQHALAHVFETHGRLDEGIAMLEKAAAGWQTRSIFMSEHNYWHLALFHLDHDEPGKALAIYDARLWGRWPSFAQEQIGAISMLWRLEMRGVDVGDRWAAVAKEVSMRADEHLWPFHDMHYAWALARTQQGQRTDTFMATLKRKADEAGGVWSEVAMPLATGLVAHARGDHASAADMIGATLPKLQRIGGSHAQRDIFVQAWMNAAFRSGQGSRLRAMLEDRVKTRPGVKIHQRDLQRLQAH